MLVGVGGEGWGEEGKAVSGGPVEVDVLCGYAVPDGHVGIGLEAGMVEMVICSDFCGEGLAVWL